MSSKRLTQAEANYKSGDPISNCGISAPLVVCCIEPGRIAREFAQVGEWLKPTDCKSVPPSEVRRFESFPVHQ